MAEDMKSGTSRPKIKVLVVDDSSTARELLVYLLASDQEIQVIGTAKNGEEALQAIIKNRPDVVTMDLHMPKMDGFEATRAIMENSPLPIVIVSSSSSSDEMASTFSALEAGALAVMKRPAGMEDPDFAANARELIQTVKLMSEVKVVKRWPRSKTMAPTAIVKPPLSMTPSARTGIRLVAIGSSTGGPLVLQQIFSSLGKHFPVPLIAVQHITAGFTEGFADWLGSSAGIPVSIAVNGETMQPGHAYLAPSGSQTALDRYGRIVLQAGIPENGHAPSVSHLFRSVATAYGPDAVGVLLTGMGKDGAAELGMMKAGGAITIAQDKQTSVVHGMPGEAIKLGAAMYVLAADKIASALENIVRQSQGASQ